MILLPQPAVVRIEKVTASRHQRTCYASDRLLGIEAITARTIFSIERSFDDLNRHCSPMVLFRISFQRKKSLILHYPRCIHFHIDSTPQNFICLMITIPRNLGRRIQFEYNTLPLSRNLMGSRNFGHESNDAIEFVAVVYDENITRALKSLRFL